MGSHMSFPCSDIAMDKFDRKALIFKTRLLCWKRFRYDVFSLWNQFLEQLNKFFYFMNSFDTTVKIKFAMSVANEDALEFLDLSLHIN